MNIANFVAYSNYFPVAKHGRVRDVYMPMDYYTGKPRGFAFVEFLGDDDAKQDISVIDYIRYYETIYCFLGVHWKIWINMYQTEENWPLSLPRNVVRQLKKCKFLYSMYVFEAS